MELIAVIGQGIGYLLMNPIFYLLIIVSIIIGMKRVKKERKEFQTRIFDVVEDLKTTFSIGIILGLLFSIFTLVIGLSFSIHTVIILSAIYSLFLLSFKPRLLSPSLVIGVATIIIMLMPHFTTGITVIDNIFTSIQARTFGQLVLLLGLLIIIEAILIMKSGTKKTGPFHLLSKRGKLIGAHEANKLWLVPLLLFIPESGGYFSPNWWPSLTIAGQSYSLIMFPFVVGFYQLVKGKLPERAIFVAGMRVLVLGVIVIIGAVFSYFYPIFIPVVVCIAIVIREGLYLYERYIDQNSVHFFTNGKDGIIILGIIPKTPAAKMKICVGEYIHKVNGQKVTNETEFYEALQINSAFCKLEVVDAAGEIRFANSALFEGDHHELGLIFVEEKLDEDSQKIAT